MINKLKYLMLPANLRRQWSFNDYLLYHMQHMSHSQIRNFLTPEDLCSMEKKLNADDFRHIFNSKQEFSHYFKDFFKREVLPVSEISFDEFREFIKRNPRFVFKPDNLYAGIGVGICELADEIPVGSHDTFNGYFNSSKENSVSLSYEYMKRENYVVESYVNQHPAYENIYPHSLNTVRVTTYIDDAGSPRILFAVNQFGSCGSLVDNDDDTAIWAGIDLETGIVNAPDIRSADGFVFDSHPDTGMPITGFCNPNFDKIKALALEAALVVPKCRLIGWDIAVNSQGEALIIEGNVTPELNLYQIISGHGLGELFS